VQGIGLMLAGRDGRADGGVHAAGEADDGAGACAVGARRSWFGHSHPTQMQEEGEKQRAGRTGGGPVGRSAGFASLWLLTFTFVGDPADAPKREVIHAVGDDLVRLR
jgi:hypothetical protein